MVSVQALRIIAESIPETEFAEERLSFSVAGKGFAWSWMERVDPKKPKVENRGVLAVRVANEDEKQGLIAADPDKFFTEPHYNGYPAVLVRLSAIEEDELREILMDAWRLRAPCPLVKRVDSETLSFKAE